MDEDERANANAEMRYLTLQLMRIAAGRKISFDAIMDEFVRNVFVLEQTIKRRTLKRNMRKARRVARMIAHSAIKPRV